MVDDAYKTPEADLLEGSQHNETLAGRGARLIASILDGIVMAIVVIPVMYITGGFEQITSGSEPPLMYSAMMGILSIIVFLIINWIPLTRSGQTVGKLVLGIKMVTLDGKLPSMGNHFLKRYAVYFIPGNIPFIGGIFSLINILFIFGSARRCLHDYAAGTKVVKV